MKLFDSTSKRYQLLLGFSAWYLLFSFFIRIIFLFWQLDEIDISFISLLRILFTGVFFDLGVLSFLYVISTLYILIIPSKFIGKKLDRIAIYSSFILSLLIFVFTFFAEITFWDEFKCRFNFVAVDYLIYTFEVVQNIHESYPLYILLPSIFLIVAVIFYFFYKNNPLGEIK